MSGGQGLLTTHQRPRAGPPSRRPLRCPSDQLGVFKRPPRPQVNHSQLWATASRLLYPGHPHALGTAPCSTPHGRVALPALLATRPAPPRRLTLTLAGPAPSRAPHPLGMRHQAGRRQRPCPGYVLAPGSSAESVCFHNQFNI